MKIIVGNLLEQTEVRCIAHCANCFCMMGAGVAAAIAGKYPEAYGADLESVSGDFEKLGSYTCADTTDGKIVFNIYGQYHGGKNIEYGALYQGLKKAAFDVVMNYSENKLAIPYLMGCGIAGGDWNIVENIIERVETKIKDYISDLGFSNPKFEIVCFDIDNRSKQ